MTQPSTDQRSRGELIAELYDRHAAGLFAYCLDQLGDADSAADALVSVFAGVTTVQPPRAALYALARREIYRRDIVYAPPSVDPVADPASALIERVLRELRPHQREVLLLSAVCGLEVEELAWVLDVACDTAADLTGSAEHRFLQALKHTLASVGRVPGHLAEIYGALTVAPIRDVLARLPWRPPPPALRAMVHAGLSPAEARAAVKRSLPVKPLWPTTPSWPLPLVDPDDASSTTGVYPVPSTPSRHELTTEPFPSQTPPALEEAPRPVPEEPAAPAQPAAVLDPPHTAEDSGASLFTPGPKRVRADEPVYLMPLPPEPSPPAADDPLPGETTDVFAVIDLPPEPPQEAPAPEEPPQEAPEPEAEAEPEPEPDAEPQPDSPKRLKPIKIGEHHYDWAWELIGFAIALAIAMIVFFAVPTIVTG